jgi:hypothetical protein
MKIYHFRVLLDSGQDIFRDIQIAENANFLDLHNAIVTSFSFSGSEMASFYMSNEDWDKGEEIALMDVMDETIQEPLRTMDRTAINHLLHHQGDKMLYVYDFLRMWIFYVELVGVQDPEENKTYPQTVLVVGNAPKEDSRESAGPMPVDFEDDLYGDDDDFDDTGEDFESLDDYEAFR